MPDTRCATRMGPDARAFSCWGQLCAHPIDLYPAECSAYPRSVRGRQFNIVHFIQHGGNAIEREEDLELGQEADAFRVAYEPRDGATRRMQEREPIASRVEERDEAAGQQHQDAHDQPYQHSDPTPHAWAHETLAGTAI